MNIKSIVCKLKLMFLAVLLVCMNMNIYSQTVSTNSAGTDNSFVIDESTVISSLTKEIQNKYCNGKAELELRLARPWTILNVHTNGELKLLEFSGKTLSPSMILKFEWRSEKQTLGPFQVVVYAKLWKDVIVAARPLTRGTVLSQNEIDYAKRDVLQLREWMEELPTSTEEIELVENVPQGQLIYPRSVRLKPILKRGQLADAFHKDGSLMISLKVEVLEDGAPGQVIKIKNPQTRRELRGTVKNDGTISIYL